ncbi:MAG: PqqD family protein [Proteobacteria bacterium]|jgi:hypothetical protein|nr:PqqD family protein [Pseudomonadota bacterium]
MTSVFDQQVKISPEVLSQEVDGEIVLLDLQSENYFGLDEVGARTWQLMQDHQELRQIVDILQNEYDVSAKQLESDIEGLLDKLVEAGLVMLEKTGTSE